ncbi:dipeptidyl-peptidase 3 family protein [Litorimonas sp. WD9-15]|uniref:dipeptidyl-peptidase 3 family protein n=1 Tax=Litorimonas sp. WD9-15 TaxID=3418716 RepID=UPI003D017AA7
MRKYLTTIAIAALIAGCSKKEAEVEISDVDAPASQAETNAPQDTSNPETEVSDLNTEAGSKIEQQYTKFAEVQMNPDTAFLSDSERAVVNKLIEASDYLSQIYLLQRGETYPALRTEIKRAGTPLQLAMFDLHYGPCDGLEEDYVFVEGARCPEGAGFYPEDMTRDEFEGWIKANPADKAAFTSGYTVIRRNDEGGLKAVPYHVEYKAFLEPAAKLMREAAEISENASLKNFLNLRADAFLTDDYFASEMAWMDLDGNIEIAIGPYEVYDDQLFGYKTAYESFVTVKNPEESAALSKYKDYLRDMEANLPVPESYKNFGRGFESPIAVTYQVHGGGDNENGVQTIAFNLPNDERVREAKGAKKVILNNVLGAKYDRILSPIGERVLVPEQADLTAKKWMSNNTLFHELSHSLGPGTISVDGVDTTVNAQLKELASGLEEGKADVMGAYNILYMMDRGELDIADKNAFLATYFTGKFRSMRFGTGAAHAKGAAFQYNYFREVGAAEWLPEEKRFRLDFEKLEQAISDLVGKVVMIQGDGNYDQAKDFLDEYLPLDEAAETVLGNLDDIPYDIRPVYPEEI